MEFQEPRSQQPFAGVRTVKKTRWGFLGEDITWPTGFVAVKRLPGSGAHGESWLLRNGIEAQLAEVNQMRKKLQAGIEKIDIGIQQGEEDLEEEEAEDSEEGSDLDEEDTFADEIDRAEHFNPHDREDLEAIIEERQALKTEFEDQLEELDNKLEELETSRLELDWKRRDLPPQLHRLDKPWEDFDKEEVKQLKQWEEELKKAQEEEIEKQRKKAERKGKKFEEPEKKVELPPDLFSVKLYEAGPATAADGRRFNFSDEQRDSGAVRSLLTEGRNIMKYQWRVIVESRSLDFQESGILPVVSVGDIVRAHNKYNPMYNAAFVSPYMERGTLEEVVRKLAGNRAMLSYSGALLKGQLKRIIRSMGFLERYGLFHGNIKPSNLFVSEDGNSLLLGDFCPISELGRWCVNVAKRLANPPTFVSPEIYHKLVDERILDFQAIKRSCNFHKNDVFCLGMVFYYATAMEEPRKFCVGAKYIERALARLESQKKDEEIIEILRRMLTFSPRNRPNWYELLDKADKFEMRKGDFMKGFNNLLGVGIGNPEDAIMAKLDKRTKDTALDGQQATDCAIM